MLKNLQPTAGVEKLTTDSWRQKIATSDVENFYTINNWRQKFYYWQLVLKNLLPIADVEKFPTNSWHYKIYYP